MLVSFYPFRLRNISLRVSPTEFHDIRLEELKSPARVKENLTMILKKVLFTSILAVQFLAMQSAHGKIVTRTDDPFPCGTCDQGPSLAQAVMKVTDDPFPCGTCDQGPSLAQAAMTVTDDPFPCGTCDQGPSLAQAAMTVTDDPFPCGTCDQGPSLAQAAMKV